MLGPLVILIAFWRAISAAEWFSWKDNYLSDLGVASGSEIPFNGGLILGGIFLLVLLWGVHAYLPERSAVRWALTVLSAAAIALMCVGIFDEDAGRIHFIVSVCFFVLASIGVLLLGRAERKHGSKKRGAVNVVMGAIIALSWAFPWPGSGGALPEMAGALCLMAVSCMYGATLVMSVCPFSAK